METFPAIDNLTALRKACIAQKLPFSGNKTQLKNRLKQERGDMRKNENKRKATAYEKFAKSTRQKLSVVGMTDSEIEAATNRRDANLPETPDMPDPCCQTFEAMMLPQVAEKLNLQFVKMTEDNKFMYTKHPVAKVGAGGADTAAAAAAAAVCVSTAPIADSATTSQAATSVKEDVCVNTEDDMREIIRKRLQKKCKREHLEYVLNNCFQVSTDATHTLDKLRDDLSTNFVAETDDEQEDV